VAADQVEALQAAVASVGQLTMALAQRGLAGDRDGMMLHSSDYLELFSLIVIAWQWVVQAAAAREGLQREGERGPSADFYRGKLSAAQYWLRTELPRAAHLTELCASGEDSYAQLRPEWL
jgi:butyryl-CoA dehydrogenase